MIKKCHISLKSVVLIVNWLVPENNVIGWVVEENILTLIYFIAKIIMKHFIVWIENSKGNFGVVLFKIRNYFALKNVINAIFVRILHECLNVCKIVIFLIQELICLINQFYGEYLLKILIKHVINIDYR